MQELSDLFIKAKDEIATSQDTQTLEHLRVTYLGKKGKLTEILKNIGKLPPQERPQAGQQVNVIKRDLNQLIIERKEALVDLELAKKLNQESIDITLPGRKQNPGNLHPVTLARQRIEAFFTNIGYVVAQGPEIEDEFHNFEALNMPAHHPARAMHDTFYLKNGYVLRTHTSPVQIRILENQQPPVRIIAPGRVYRCDSDVTHTPMFNQVEGLVIDKESSFADLKGVLQVFLTDFFENEIELRFRPSFFPFTEPSAEADIRCVKCSGKGCRICSNTGWLEVLGCGMVHPNVLKAVDINPDEYQGYAFGLGIDRLAMLRYEIDDLRILFENDVRMLSQF